MADIVPAHDIERIVGARRHSTQHLGRAVSTEQRIYILHSGQCLASGIDLRECPYSVALDTTVEHNPTWRYFEDQLLILGLTKPEGVLVPVAVVDCCDLHSRTCETPSELCCRWCGEWDHPTHRDGSICVNPDLSPNAPEASS